MLRSIGRTAATLICLALLPTAAFSRCILFEHRDFDGARLVLQNGQRVKMVAGNSTPDILYRPGWNDQVSSYLATDGCLLNVWEHIDAQGWMQITSGSVAYIGDRRNDQISEALCSCR